MPSRARGEAPAVRLVQRTLAASDLPGMVRFYNGAFGCALEAAGGGVFRRPFRGHPLWICANELAGVVAEQNRLQLDLWVADLPAMITAIESHGGRIRDQDGACATAVDPDGNTIVLHAER